jgi:hypothetical protein
VNVPVAACPPASTARTVVPTVPLGALKVHANVPVAPVVSEPLVQLVIDTPSKTSDPRTVETENPVPETVTAAPTGPWAGFTVMAGIVTVNVVVGVSPEPTSVASMSWEPALELGTVNVQTKPPAAVVVMVVPPPLSVPDEQLVNASEIPANVTVTEFDIVNPVPVRVAELPIGPWAGLTVIACGVTVNV